MGKYEDPYETVLKPRVYLESPPWASKKWPWPFNKKYEGRKEWWAEAGYKDFNIQWGKYPVCMYQVLEEDPTHWDPKVPDGETIASPMGLDQTYYTNYAVKADQPGDFKEYQKKLMKNCPQYRQIAENWDLSKEHPGMKVNPKLDALDHHSKFTLGRFEIKHNLYHLGPKFWNEPLNEGCIEKGLALGKYSMIWGLFSAYSKVRENYKIMPHGEYRIRKILGLGMPEFPKPFLFAFTYGFTICMVARIRNKDDTWNWPITAAIQSLIYTSLTNKYSNGVLMFFALSFLGIYYQYNRCMPSGLAGHHYHQDSGGYNMPGPFAWKFFYYGQAKPYDKEEYSSY